MITIYKSFIPNTQNFVIESNGNKLFVPKKGIIKSLKFFHEVLSVNYKEFNKKNSFLLLHNLCEFTTLEHNIFNK